MVGLLARVGCAGVTARTAARGFWDVLNNQVWARSLTGKRRSVTDRWARFWECKPFCVSQMSKLKYGSSQCQKLHSQLLIGMLDGESCHEHYICFGFSHIQTALFPTVACFTAQGLNMKQPFFKWNKIKQKKITMIKSSSDANSHTMYFFIIGISHPAGRCSLRSCWRQRSLICTQMQ